jgi:hypothetical protein
MRLLKFKLEDYIIENQNKFDYDKIVCDFWKTGFYSNKLDLLTAIMSFGRGKLLSSLVMNAINRNLQNF